MERQRNINLLRIVSIFFITMHHLTINGIFNLDALSNGAYPTEILEITFFASMLNAFLVVGVNIFFLISGYFQIKLSIKKIFSLIIYFLLNAIFIVIFFTFCYTLIDKIIRKPVSKISELLEKTTLLITDNLRIFLFDH